MVDYIDLLHLVTVYNKIHAAKAGSHMYSSDATVQAIATQDTLMRPTASLVSSSPGGGGDEG